MKSKILDSEAITYKPFVRDNSLDVWLYPIKSMFNSINKCGYCLYSVGVFHDEIKLVCSCRKSKCCYTHEEFLKDERFDDVLKKKYEETVQSLVNQEIIKLLEVEQ